MFFFARKVRWIDWIHQYIVHMMHTFEYPLNMIRCVPRAHLISWCKKVLFLVSANGFYALESRCWKDLPNILSGWCTVVCLSVTGVNTPIHNILSNKWAALSSRKLRRPEDRVPGSHGSTNPKITHQISLKITC